MTIMSTAFSSGTRIFPIYFFHTRRKLLSTKVAGVTCPPATGLLYYYNDMYTSLVRPLFLFYVCRVVYCIFVILL